jgi:hypothetical protein
MLLAWLLILCKYKSYFIADHTADEMLHILYEFCAVSQKVVLVSMFHLRNHAVGFSALWILLEHQMRNLNSMAPSDS